MRYFITGGTGTLGTALLEHIKDDITVYSRDEVKQADLKQHFPDVRFVLGDVRDYQWLLQCMRNHDTVVHTAAYKQVPAAEVNSSQAVGVNIIGSLNVARAAVANDIEKVVGISTDKACEPVNCYGATKMVMEKLFQEAAGWGYTNFTIVRYGNIIGSRGSVVPFFRKQLATQGYVTLTNPAMTRFWLTQEEAVRIVLDGIMFEKKACVLVPKCKACSMELLARVMAGNRVKITGTRPGEKLHECLLHSSEALHVEELDNYYVVFPATVKMKGLPGFSYTSDRAPQFTETELKELINNA